MSKLKGLSTGQIDALLASRYCAPEYALLFNVKNRTGFGMGGSDRFADAVAMNLYPSRGMEVLGFEVKASRGDWIKERDDPAKAEAIAKFCDRWWLVVGDPDIVKPGELPPTWGLLVPGRGGLVVATDAPKLDAEPLNRRFIAAMLRRAVEQSPEVVAAAEQRGYERGYKLAEKNAASHLGTAENARKHLDEELLRLRQDVQWFEQAAGIAISGYRTDRRIGEVVRLALAGRFDGDLERIRDQLTRLAAATDESIAALKAMRDDAEMVPESETTR